MTPYRKRKRTYLSRLEEREKKPGRDAGGSYGDNTRSAWIITKLHIVGNIFL